MTSKISFSDIETRLREQTAVVIPAYFPPGAENDRMRSLLEETALSYCHELGDAQAVCLCADGPGEAAEAMEELRKEYGVRATAAEEHLGKLGALRTGMSCLLEDESYRYLATVDQDGDHFPNELRNLVRAARGVETDAGGGRVMVLGRRISKHRPLGFFRGELEELADRMLLDALQYRAALDGQPLRMEYANTLDEYPDFHSGYKLFDRQTAADVFLSEPRAGGVSADCYYKHAVEAVMSVEALQAGARLAVVNRSTMNEQPVSTFALLERARMTADKIVWPCRRLEVPGEFVDQWMRNHIPRLLMGTIVPEGRRELKQVWQLVKREFQIEGEEPDDGSPFKRPRFI